MTRDATCCGSQVQTTPHAFSDHSEPLIKDPARDVDKIRYMMPDAAGYEAAGRRFEAYDRSLGDRGASAFDVYSPMDCRVEDAMEQSDFLTLVYDDEPAFRELLAIGQEACRDEIRTALAFGAEVIHCWWFYAGISGMLTLVVFSRFIIHWPLAVLTVVLAGLFMVAIGLLLGSVVEVRAQQMLYGWFVIIPLLIPVFLVLMEEFMPATAVAIKGPTALPTEAADEFMPITRAICCSSLMSMRKAVSAGVISPSPNPPTIKESKTKPSESVNISPPN